MLLYTFFINNLKDNIQINYSVLEFENKFKL